jgi:polyhydroxybutyrate depolymerase
MLFLLACAAAPSDDTAAPTWDPDPPDVIGGDRPAEVVLPAAYSVDQEWPLVVLLHGYGANADLQDVVFGLGERADTLGFVLVKPEGTTDSSGAQFWNATDECCDFDGSGVDDVGYLTALLDEARATYRTSTVALVGHSNGGYMSYRMACEVPERIDRIAVLAGATFKDEADCVGTQPVEVLHIHGTEDEEVPYESNPAHAGAEESIGRWVTKAGCTASEVVGTKDYLGNVDGEETTVTQWSGCDGGRDFQLWSAAGGDHVFLPNTTGFKDDVAGWVTR